MPRDRGMHLAGNATSERHLEGGDRGPWGVWRDSLPGRKWECAWEDQGEDGRRQRKERGRQLSCGAGGARLTCCWWRRRMRSSCAPCSSCSRAASAWNWRCSRSRRSRSAARCCAASARTSSSRRRCSSSFSFCTFSHLAVLQAAGDNSICVRTGARSAHGAAPRSAARPRDRHDPPLRGSAALGHGAFPSSSLDPTAARGQTELRGRRALSGRRPLCPLLEQGVPRAQKHWVFVQEACTLPAHPGWGSSPPPLQTAHSAP